MSRKKCVPDLESLQRTLPEHGLEALKMLLITLNSDLERQRSRPWQDEEKIRFLKCVRVNLTDRIAGFAKKQQNASITRLRPADVATAEREQPVAVAAAS